MPEQKTFWSRALGTALVVAVLGVWVWIEATPPPRTAPPAGQAIAIDKSPRAQGERKAVIDKLLADGLVRNIDDAPRAGTLRASLRAGFYALDEATRREYADVIYRYHFDGSSVNDRITMRDAKNGNEVGEYNPYKGGLKMYR